MKSIDKLLCSIAALGLMLMLLTGEAYSFWIFSASYVIGIANIVYMDIKSKKVIQHKDTI